MEQTSQMQAFLADPKLKHWQRRIIKENILRVDRWEEATGYLNSPSELSSFFTTLASVIEEDIKRQQTREFI